MWPNTAARWKIRAKGPRKRMCWESSSLCLDTICIPSVLHGKDIVWTRHLHCTRLVTPAGTYVIWLGTIYKSAIVETVAVYICTRINSTQTHTKSHWQIKHWRHVGTVLGYPRNSTGYPLCLDFYKLLNSSVATKTYQRTVKICSASQTCDLCMRKLQ